MGDYNVILSHDFLEKNVQARKKNTAIILMNEITDLSLNLNLVTETTVTDRQETGLFGTNVVFDRRNQKRAPSVDVTFSRCTRRTTSSTCFFFGNTEHFKRILLKLFL